MWIGTLGHPTIGVPSADEAELRPESARPMRPAAQDMVTSLRGWVLVVGTAPGGRQGIGFARPSV